jgi:hypothetical protein
MVEQFISHFSFILDNPIFIRALSFIWVISPIWISLALLIWWFNIWMKYKQREWIAAQGSVLLEIKIPRDMFKSPLAMEIFLNTLYSTGVGTLIDVYLKGRVRNWFSLELVSTGGDVHFYIWSQKSQKNKIETQLYAQFPNVEVHEVPDYTLGVHRNPDKISIGWFGQYALTKPDAYPIKTYIDYGLDKNDKEEYKNDPIVPMLEFLGSLKKGENAWFQILIQAHTKEGLKYGRISIKPDWNKRIYKEKFTCSREQGKNSNRSRHN